jgi:hypothetical protein
VDDEPNATAVTFGFKFCEGIGGALQRTSLAADFSLEGPHFRAHRLHPFDELRRRQHRPLD